MCKELSNELVGGARVAITCVLGGQPVEGGRAGSKSAGSGWQLTPRLPALRQVRYGNEFEGVSTFAPGLAGRTGFRVLELRNPNRLAIDVAH